MSNRPSDISEGLFQRPEEGQGDLTCHCIELTGDSTGRVAGGQSAQTELILTISRSDERFKSSLLRAAQNAE